MRRKPQPESITPKSKRAPYECRPTQRQRAFAIEYLKDFNATQAAVRAGYTPTVAPVVGCRNAKNPRVQAEMRKVMAEYVVGGETCDRLRAEHGHEKAQALIEKIAIQTVKRAYQRDYDRACDQMVMDSIERHIPKRE